MVPLAGNTRQAISVFSLCCVVVWMTGCSPFAKSRNEAGTANRSYSPLANARVANDVVALEIAVARLDGKALDQFNEIWGNADVQTLSLPVRKRLDRNGMRVGLLGTQLPGELTSALSYRQPLLTEDGEILFNSRQPLPPPGQGSFAVKQIEQMGPGESHWVPCSPRLAQVPWSIASNSTTRSGICEAAQCGFMITQVPVSGDAIKLWLRPEIRHGETRMRYGIDQETLLVQEKQKRLRFDELDFPHRIRLGQTLVITTTPTPAGIGEQFFATGQFASSRHVLLIRPVRISKDDLFSPARTSRRLSTSLD